MPVWDERNFLRMSASVSTAHVRQWLAQQIQLFVYLDILDAALCPLLSLLLSRESPYSVLSHLLFILLTVKLYLLTFLRSVEPALSDIPVFCIFTVSCQIPYE